MLAAAMSRGAIDRIHAGREAGLQALEKDLLGLGVTLITTKGHNPTANGGAEAAVGLLAGLARAPLAPY